MKKLKLNPEVILNKSFNVGVQGYEPTEVDSFLDDVLEDYQIMEANMQEMLDLISKLQEQVKTLNKKTVELQGTKKAFDLTNTTNYSSVDLLKRISRLEEVVYNK